MNYYYSSTLNNIYPLGIPLVYELDSDLKPVKHYYLASDDEIKKALNKVAAQGKAAK